MRGEVGEWRGVNIATYSLVFRIYMYITLSGELLPLQAQVTPRTQIARTSYSFRFLLSHILLVALSHSSGCFELWDWEILAQGTYKEANYVFFLGLFNKRWRLKIK